MKFPETTSLPRTSERGGEGSCWRMGSKGIENSVARVLGRGSDPGVEMLVEKHFSPTSTDFPSLDNRKPRKDVQKDIPHLEKFFRKEARTFHRRSFPGPSSLPSLLSSSSFKDSSLRQQIYSGIDFITCCSCVALS
ncbi:hypothetical protein Leryth_013447 [Lithospermum erythrorhizon]|nr:hypothetical protein Leryth_013447 [Lithospermum erythrorhizon]